MQGVYLDGKERKSDRERERGREKVGRAITKIIIFLCGT